MRYKVGDKVRIIRDLVSSTNKFYPVEVTPKMEAMRGSETEILSVVHNRYHLTVDDGDWNWTDGMLEPIRDTEIDNGLPHPPHYTNGLIETIDVIKMALTPEEFRGFLKGNVMKYQIRAPHKNETPDEDYQKAKDYYDLLEGLE